MISIRTSLRSVAAGLAVSAGLAGPAPAADLPLRGSLALPEPVAQPYDWSGFHIGIEAGWGRAGKQVLKTTGTTAQEQALIDVGGLGAVPFADSSWIAGGGLGYDLQFGPGSGFVVGLLTDVAATGMRQSRTTSFAYGPNAIDVEAHQGLDYLGTVRGRVGYAFDRVFVYGTGGFAYGGVDLMGRTSLTNAGYSGPFDAGRYDGMQTGYAYGGGAAFALSGPFSVKVEYLRYDLGTKLVPINGTGSVFGPGGPLDAGHTGDSRFRTQGQIVKAGIDYRFSSFGF